jgi:hypothetical protein
VNVEARGKPELALSARRRAVELRALKYGAKSDVEREALEAVYAYERVLLAVHGKNMRASYTWRMINESGILAAVEKVVSRKSDAKGYTALVEMGMQDMAFEAVVLRYPNVFSTHAVERSRERLAGWSRSSSDEG